MSREHWRPLAAFVVLALVCVGILVTGLRSDAVRGLLGLPPRTVVAGGEIQPVREPVGKRPDVPTPPAAELVHTDRHPRGTAPRSGPSRPEVKPVPRPGRPRSPEHVQTPPPVPEPSPEPVPTLDPTPVPAPVPEPDQGRGDDDAPGRGHDPHEHGPDKRGPRGHGEHDGEDHGRGEGRGHGRDPHGHHNESGPGRGRDYDGHHGHDGPGRGRGRG